MSLASVPVNVCRHPKEYNPTIYFSMSHDLACALIETDRYVYNLQFYCITEEVMLAEENKNSGRSPLDGKFTHFG